MTKTYTPTEVAIQVLKKTAELMADLKKTNTAHEVEMGQDPAAGSITPGQDKSNGQPQGNSQSQPQSQSTGEAPKKKKKMNPDGTESDEYEEREILDQHNEQKHGEPKNENSAFKGASPAAQQEKKQEQPSAGQKPTEQQKPEQKEAQGEKPQTKTNFPSFGKSEEDLNKNYPSEKHVKGVNRTSVEGHNFKGGKSNAGSQVAFSQGPAASKHPAMKEKNIAAAKESHKKVLGEMKDMKKPNLPKSEDMAKEEKGVHQPHARSKNGGTSEAGYGVGTAHLHGSSYPAQAKDTIKQVKQKHKEVLGDLKSMKKPNLPKSEDEGADQDVKNIKIKSTKLKSFLEKKMAKREGI